MEKLKYKLFNELQSGVVSKIYKKTYNSLIDRFKDNGYLEESLTGAYAGEYCRTIGGFVQLLMETGDFGRAKKALEFVFESMIRNKISKIPHTLGEVSYFEDGTFVQWVGTDDQIDGRAHIILAFVRLCLVINDKEFENKYYDLIKTELKSCLDQPYFYYQPGMVEWSCTNLGLIFNCSFEHSRENRRWSAFDLLSQNFIGASTDEMIKLAKRRNDNKFESFLKLRLDVLKNSIDIYMTRIVNGKKVYLEMRLPDSNYGKEYKGMGWVCYSSIPAQWEALDRKVLQNTIELLREKLYIHDPENENINFTTLEFDEKDNITYSVIGKSMGWDIEYCRQERQYDKIMNWFKFLNKYHSDSDVLMEQINLIDRKWIKADCGNGEQCVWWCLAIARLRNELRISPDQGMQKNLNEI